MLKTFQQDLAVVQEQEVLAGEAEEDLLVQVLQA